MFYRSVSFHDPPPKLGVWLSVNTCLFGISARPLLSPAPKARVHWRSPIIPPMNNTPSECLELYKTRISSSLSVVSGSPCLSFFHHKGLSAETYGHREKQKPCFHICVFDLKTLISSSITRLSALSFFIRLFHPLRRVCFEFHQRQL